MTKYLNRIRIETHSQFEGHMTEVVDLESETPIPNVERIDLTIQPREPVLATLTLVHIDGEAVSREQAHCPDVDLLPLVALIEQASCGKYRLDGTSWEYLADGSLLVCFKQVNERNEHNA